MRLIYRKEAQTLIQAYRLVLIAALIAYSQESVRLVGCDLGIVETDQCQNNKVRDSCCKCLGFHSPLQIRPYIFRGMYMPS